MDNIVSILELINTIQFVMLLAIVGINGKQRSIMSSQAVIADRLDSISDSLKGIDYALREISREIKVTKKNEDLR